jgi:hypothetical protein
LWMQLPSTRKPSWIQLHQSYARALGALEICSSESPANPVSSTCLNNQQKKLLFLLRSKMVDVRDNFREKYKNDKICKICNTEVENQEHVLLCTEITQQANVLIDNQVEVSDIFADEVEKQSRITVLFETLWTLRSKIIKEREIKTN